MNEIASPGQLRMSFIRWALVTVPLIVGLGTLMGRLSNSGDGNAWFDALVIPDIMPPGWLFGVAWAILYTMQALALALILNARGAPGRGLAIAAFLVQLIANYCWSPLFFGMHQITAAFWLILVILAAAIVTTLLFGRIRSAAAWLMLPYMAWLSFASILNFQFDVANPYAETLVPPAASANIEFRQGE